MRFTVDYPIGAPGFDRRFLEPRTMTTFVTALESAGVDAVGFTEHPAPSKKWLDGGGHETFDPLTALAFCAASTSRIRLMTHLLVLPYRNPLLAAKQIATADVLSGGRLIVAAGAGYLRSEFAALGVDFDERNDLFDEALEVLRSVWRDDEIRFDGKHFTAVGQVVAPGPVQRPHPPIWIGGNSRIARMRAARSGDGWAPMGISDQMSRTTRTAAIETVDDLRAAIDELRRLAADAGRAPESLDVQVQWRAASRVDGDPDDALRMVARLAAAGVTWLVLNPPNVDVNHCIDAVISYADKVISRARDITG